MNVKLPSLGPPVETDPSYGADFEDYAVGTYEWLSMVLLESPRIDPEDNIDPFLSRYVPPGDSHASCKLAKVTLPGFISPSWAHKSFFRLLITLPRNAWFAYCVSGFPGGLLDDGRSCTVLKLPDDSTGYVLWEIE